jgi:hypothetical protein
MKLEYLDNISSLGEYAGVVTNQLIRLFDFDKTEAEKFKQAIRKTIMEENQSLELSDLDFIQSVNCSLTLRISKDDKGITTEDQHTFICDLTKKGYQKIISFVEPFCNKDNDGYQWLYDINTPIEFLFSPSGEW